MSNSLSFKEKEHWKDRISQRIDKKISTLCEKDGFLNSVTSKAREIVLAATGVKGLQRTLDKIFRDESELYEDSEKLRDEAEKKKEAVDRQFEPKIDDLEKQVEALKSQASVLRKERNRKKELVEEKLEPAVDANRTLSEKLDSQVANTVRKMLAKIRGVPVRDVRKSEYYDEDDIADEISGRQQDEVDKILATSDRGKTILTLREEKENLLDTVWLATSGKQIKDLWIQVVDLLGDNQTKLLQEAQELEPVEAE